MSICVQNMQYAPAVLHSITNPDGSVSILNLDPNNPIITLPDGTTAQVVSVSTQLYLTRHNANGRTAH